MPTATDGLTGIAAAEAEIADLRKLLAGREKEWRCFHCDTVFTNRKHAAEHFGCDEGETPACKLSHSEGHLVAYIRRLQAELKSYHEENDEILLAWEAHDAEHREALRREEEKGFARGVEDMKKHGYQIG